MAHVLITGNGFVDDHFARIRANGHTIAYHPAIAPDALQAALASADGYVMGGDEYVDAAALERADRLRVVSFVGVGYGTFMDVAALARRSIAIRNTPGATSGAVAEAAIGLAIAARRRLFPLSTAAKRDVRVELASQDFAGAVVGIVGLGNIGTQVARCLRLGFDQRVVYTSRTRKPALESELGIAFAPLRELVGQVDIVILAVPTAPDTVAMIDGALLAACKRGIIIVNPASHQLVDTAAIVAALREGQVATFVQDGLPEDAAALRELDDDRVVLLPHSLAKTPRAWDRTLDLAVDNLLGFFEGTTR